MTPKHYWVAALTCTLLSIVLVVYRLVVKESSISSGIPTLLAFLGIFLMTRAKKS
jgi:uncharacterized membrane protein YhaH (DUF805 family)